MIEGPPASWLIGTIGLLSEADSRPIAVVVRIKK